MKDLKDHLSGYLKKVQAGEEMIITSHEKPLAKIIPFTPEDAIKANRDQWLNKIHNLHLALGNLKLKEPMSQLILKNRKDERY